jgi:hypothetical protein
MQEPSTTLLAACLCSTMLLGLLFSTEAGGSSLFRNFGKVLPDYTASYPRHIVFFIPIFQFLLIVRSLKPQTKPPAKSYFSNMDYSIILTEMYEHS